jgi:hypothetical protein
MDNEVVIHVRVKNEGKTGFEAFAKEADAHAKKISESFSTTFTETIRKKLSSNDSGGIFDTPTAEAAGRSFGDRFGGSAVRRITERITQRFRDGSPFGSNGGNGGDGGRGRSGGNGGNGGDATVNVDVDKQSIFSRFFSAGKDAASRFADGFKSSAESVLSGVFSGDILSTVIKGISVAALAVVLAPVIGAAISTAIGLALGGGVLAAGIAGAFKDPIVLGAAKGTLANLKAELENFGKNFTAPLENFFVRFQEFMKSLKPQLDDLGKAFAPVLTELGNGFIGLLQNALPGVVRAAEKAKPIFEVLADKMPMIGDAIGRFFDHIGDSGDDAALFFGDLLEVIGLIIRAAGVLVEMFTIAYRDIRIVISGIISGLAAILRVAADAFSWDPVIGPKLRSASQKVDAFATKFNDSFRKLDRDVQVNVRINVVGLSAARAAIDLATKLSKLGYAHGGIVGAATGGLHGGLRMVGEAGPELLELPPGTRVNSAGDTARMLSGAGQAVGQIIVQLVMDGKVLAQQLVEPTRELVRTQGNGSTQGFYGQAGVA